MATLRDKLATDLPRLRDEMKALLKEHGEKVVSTVTLQQVFGGMRGVKSLLCDTSNVPADKGLIVRGKPIADLTDRLPEEIFYLLLTGELPGEDAKRDLADEFRERGVVPRYVWQVLEALPAGSHPMAMLSAAILSLEHESKFRRFYREGMGKDEYWEPMLDDCLNLLAKLPGIAAYIYRLRFDKGPRIPGDSELDWGANFAKMLGIEDGDGRFTRLVRLYLVLHCDHEGGNVSALTTHTVGSALSDAYYALSAGLNGLAGPLHGLANQECLRWTLGLMHKFGGTPTKDQIMAYTRETLADGKVIPGYGHAVLRVVDPRFTAFYEFGEKHCAGDPVFETVKVVFQAVPEVLKTVEKISNPWPNVDAVSGSLLWHFGMKEFSYYTVLFGVSRAMGVLSNLVINRGVGGPIVRPKSITTELARKLASEATAS
ncbi:MAG: citrate (Si)-synthase [Planctomycetota bacterium]